MKREVVLPWPLHPEHRTPYVPAIKIKIEGGTLLFLSGMGPHKPDHKHPHVPEEWILPDDAAAQARMVLDKINRIVEAAGGTFQNVVKITRYFKDINDQDKVNELIHEYFGETLPCSTTIQVAAFVVPTMLIEIDAWAVIPDPAPAAAKPKAAARRAGARKAPSRSRPSAAKASAKSRSKAKPTRPRAKRKR
jgi:2-iminobutanoate/2-iminopropanoate deaminase